MDTPTLPNNPRIGRGVPLARLLPNMLTLMSLCSGLTAMRYALHEKWEAAALAIVIASVFDILDGRVAPAHAEHHQQIRRGAGQPFRRHQLRRRARVRVVSLAVEGYEARLDRRSSPSAPRCGWRASTRCWRTTPRPNGPKASSPAFQRLAARDWCCCRCFWCWNSARGYRSPPRHWRFGLSSSAA